ncbi:MAG: XrtA/PEP-CTERM system histidine kinase PrsK [Gammaproteobacteria bacterium]
MGMVASSIVAVHTLAASLFAVLAFLLVSGNRLRGRVALLGLATIALAVWNIMLAVAVLRSATPAEPRWLQTVHAVGWLLLSAAIVSSIGRGFWLVSIRAVGVGALGATALALASGTFDLSQTFAVTTFIAVVAAFIEMSWRAKWLPPRAWTRFAVCAAAVLVSSVLISSRWTQTASVADSWLAARGLIVVALAPLLAVLCRQAERMQVRVFVSRYALTAVIAGAVAVTIVGVPTVAVYRLVQDDPHQLRAVFLTAVVAAGAAALVQLLGRGYVDWIRVQISKHFYRFKYDYRDEWLRLTDNLATPANDLPIPKRAVKALGDLIGSEAGVLFVAEQEGQSFVPAASWNTRADLLIQEYRRDALIDLMQSAEWIVDSAEAQTARDVSPSFVEDLLHSFPGGVLVVPLLVVHGLLGFVALERPPALRRLSYEELDLLRTAGRQVASYVGQHYMAARLIEGRQFEAFGRMTAFLLHDLTNISAQQSLIVQNAERHKNNAEFVADAMRTISASVSRINRLVALIRAGVEHAQTTETATADAAAIIEEAVKLCGGYLPHPKLSLPSETIRIVTDADRLSHGLAHLIRNSQQAAAGHGEVTVSLGRDQEHAVIKVTDNGSGMSEDFVRERLFRPFDSTKEGNALGIGAFQLREIVHASGGTLGIRSIEGVGSVFSIRIPLAASSGTVERAAAL